MTIPLRDFLHEGRILYPRKCPEDPPEKWKVIREFIEGEITENDGTPVTNKLRNKWWCVRESDSKVELCCFNPFLSLEEIKQLTKP